MFSLNDIDQSVRKQSLRPRALKEEEGFGLTIEPPVRRALESTSYWHIRNLAHQICNMHYRTPQMNLYLLQYYINSQQFGEFPVTGCIYVAPGEAQMRFTTTEGEIHFGAMSPVDPIYFLSRFGIEKKF